MPFVFRIEYLPPGSLQRIARANFENNALKYQMLRAMGAKLFEMTNANFGASGKSRPNTWPSLKSKYAKRVKRTYATLDLTGRMYQNNRMTIHADSVTCSWLEPYALFHQTGTSKMPRRGFVPMDESGTLTPFAQRKIIEAASRVVERWKLGNITQVI